MSFKIPRNVNGYITIYRGTLEANVLDFYVKNFKDTNIHFVLISM